MSKVALIEYDRNDARSKKYVLMTGVEDTDDSWAVLDITRQVSEDVEADWASGYSNWSGPQFAYAVCNAVRAGRAYEDVYARWKLYQDDSSKPRVAHPGTWKLLKKQHTKIIREWSPDV